MKGWLQTLGLTALLATHALANEAELVNSYYSFDRNDQSLMMFRRNPTMHTDNDAQGCTVARLGEEVSTPSFW